MRPLLDEHEAWWTGPQGKLTGELSSLCGPDSDGWRNRDVLILCSSHPIADCAALASHCEVDIEAMRKNVADLSQKARNTGSALLAALDEISPPDDISLDHKRFLACLQAQVTYATQVRRLARGELRSDPDLPTACQVFTSAEINVREYVGNP
jgi:hypothetical protein